MSEKVDHADVVGPDWQQTPSGAAMSSLEAYYHNCANQTAQDSENIEGTKDLAYRVFKAGFAPVSNECVVDMESVGS